ncbi:enoyl-CoA hydratase-related protein [Sphingomonas morindae]|uniref:Enoyl-CoA hydratase/isomerase family protein n=1 Tax=Sphingomonas morindae TaxID=1541170 RepID=A0ABY4X447_9SPHN|nr:enoyl-CoA hydratase-related protein [Sphingomonas morindae]USI71651.1 enoyl-CoA hydratase/isomerase family protein [Sphingomonas morindae]
MMAVAVERPAPGVLELRLARPEKKNALTGAMYRHLCDGLREAAADPQVAVVLIRAEGEDFCAGNDIGDFLQADGAQAALGFVRALALFDKPLVAAVQGRAVGIGTTMLLHCDLIYAAPDARFSTPFVTLGLVPEAAASLLLPARIGATRASAMLLLGEPLAAEAAAGAGLVSALVPGDALAETARAKAAALAALPRAAVVESRRLMRGDRAAIEARIEEEARCFRAALSGPDAREAFAAFIEKRPPRFGGAA